MKYTFPLKDASAPTRKFELNETSPFVHKLPPRDTSPPTNKCLLKEASPVANKLPPMKILPPTPIPPPTIRAPVVTLVDTVVLEIFKFPPLKVTSPPTNKLPPDQILPATPIPPPTIRAPVETLVDGVVFTIFKLPPIRASLLKDTSLLTFNLPPKDTSPPTKILALKEMSNVTVLPMVPVGPTRPPYGNVFHDVIPLPILNLLVSVSMASSPSAKRVFALVHCEAVPLLNCN